MYTRLHIDVETYSTVDLLTSGAHKYAECLEFEILMIAYAFDDDPVQIIDLHSGEKMPKIFTDALLNPEIEKHAQNAAFERVCFKAIGYDVPVEQWRCTMIKAAFCGLPLGLDQLSKVMKLRDKGKIANGKALIRYFCVPCKPTKKNLQRVRNTAKHEPEKWAEFLAYCVRDVVAERQVFYALRKYRIPAFEQRLYCLDQQINDRGVYIDLDFARNAYAMYEKRKTELHNRIVEITGIDNPNSAPQLVAWLNSKLQQKIKSIAKEALILLLDQVPAGSVREVLLLRQKAAKSSIKKYLAMENCASYEDGRARGMFQFYGANRTGRWAGRRVQLQNLRRNYLTHLTMVRGIVADNDYDLLTMMFDNVADVLSQLIRTAFIAKLGHLFVVADFSAIEARVTAWLAGEQWRLDVFNSHGKIYEASAASMYDVPLESVTKKSKMREKGKVAELALGYQGSIGAMQKMGGKKMGLSVPEMKSIVKKWRAASPAIVKLWRNMETAAMIAVAQKRKVLKQGIEFDCDGKVLTIKLPSGRKLYYQQPSFTLNKWGKRSLQYKGLNQDTKQWQNIDTYGGKLTENIVQAIARDILAISMINLDSAGFKICMHVHDEAVCEVLEKDAEEALETMCAIMGEPISWAKGLPLAADGYVTSFYKKD